MFLSTVKMLRFPKKKKSVHGLQICEIQSEKATKRKQRRLRWKQNKQYRNVKDYEEERNPIFHSLRRCPEDSGGT